MSRMPPYQPKPGFGHVPTLYPARRAGERGMWDGHQFWPLPFLQEIYAGTTEQVAALEAQPAATIDRAKRAAIWWRWGFVARLLTVLDSPPTPPVPHRVERVALPESEDSIYCWPCDAFLPRPAESGPAAEAAWADAIRAFEALHRNEDETL